MKLNLGCGGNILQGFENHDIEQTGVDITKPLPWPDNSVEFILAEHVFEHIPGPDALRFLDECYRVLAQGEILRLCVPVLDRLSFEAKRDIILNHGHLCAYTPGLLRMFFLCSGAGRLWSKVTETPRKDCDGHWRVIGEEKDDLETCRLEATK